MKSSCQNAHVPRLGFYLSNGKIACILRLRPCLAEPPADHPRPDTIQIMLDPFLGQSASLPGKPAMSNALLRRVISRALRAASRARAASMILPAIDFAACGFSSNYQRMICSLPVQPQVSLHWKPTFLWFVKRISDQALSLNNRS